MTTRAKEPNVVNRLRDVERKQKHHGRARAYDPDDRPGPVQDVVIDFRLREKRKDLRYTGIVTWDPLPKNQCQADIAYYDIQIRATSRIGTPKGRMHRNQYIVKNPDDLEADDLQIVFFDIEHPKIWYWQARVRAVDKDDRVGEWSDYTDPELPFASANPQPPYPSNIIINFNKDESDRHEPRWRCIVQFDEITHWDVPPSDGIDSADTTLKTAVNIGDNTIDLDDGTGIPDPLAGIPQDIAIEPSKDEIEIVSYTTKTPITGGVRLSGVVRGLEGTTERHHDADSKVKLRAQDAQEAETDLKAYIVQIRKCNVDGTGAFTSWATNGGKFIQREQRHAWRAESDDADGLVRTVFPNVRWRHHWRARVRTEDRFNRLGKWSDWTTVGSPSDTTPPPQPNGPILVYIHNTKVHVDWNFEPDPDDANNQHPDISHYQVELHSGSAFDGTTLITKDYYCGSTKKVFLVKKAANNYWARVRSVDGSGNKSSWLTSNASKQRPPQPSAPNAASFVFVDSANKEKGAKMHVEVPFTYSEAGYNEDHIDYYAVELIVTDGPSYAGTEKRRREHVDGRGDDAENDSTDPKSAVFKGIKRRKWVRARLRAVDKDNRKSDWSLWSSSAQVADTDAPPAPTSVTVDNDVKGVMVDWDIPDETYVDSGGVTQTDTDVPSRDVDHYEAEVHSNSGFTARVKRDKHVTATQKKFKWAGFSEGATYYARVRSVSSTGVKSGWTTSTGFTTQAIVDTLQLVDNAVTRPKVIDDAIGTSELDDGGTLVANGTWKNSTGATRVEISSGRVNNIDLYVSGYSNPSTIESGGGYTYIRPANNSSGTAGLIQVTNNPYITLGSDEVFRNVLWDVPGWVAFQAPGGAVGAGETWGVGWSWAAATKLDSAPGSVTFSNINSDDNNVSSVSASDITTRGFLFKVTANAAGTVVRALREYHA